MSVETTRPLLKDISKNIDLLVPLIFLVLATFELIGIVQLQPSQSEKGLFAARYFFWGHSHVFLTLLFPFVFRSVSSWNSNSILLGMKPFKALSFFWLIFFLLSYFSISDLESFSNLLFLGFILRLYHNIFQSYGVTVLYRVRDKMSFQFESYIKFLFYLKFIFTLLSYKFFLTKVGLNENSQFFFLTIQFFIDGLILVLFFLEEPRNFRKIFCALRIVLVSLAPISQFALLGFVAVHGIEYLLVYSKFNSAQNDSSKSAFFAYFALAIVLMTILSFPRLLSNELRFLVSNERLLWMLTAFVFASNMTHYFADYFIFKFKNSTNRKFILPSLVR